MWVPLDHTETILNSTRFELLEEESECNELVLIFTISIKTRAWCPTQDPGSTKWEWLLHILPSGSYRGQGDLFRSLWEGPRGLVFRSYRMGEDSWLIWIGEKPLIPVMVFSKGNKLPRSWFPVGSPSLEMPNQSLLPWIIQLWLWNFCIT